MNRYLPFERDERFKIKSENEQFVAFANALSSSPSSKRWLCVTQKSDRKWILRFLSLLVVVVVRMMVRFWCLHRIVVHLIRISYGEEGSA